MSSNRHWKNWLPLALFSVLWGDLIHQLSYQWEASEQYAYGWFVPVLAVALFWNRWQARPPARVVAPSIAGDEAVPIVVAPSSVRSSPLLPRALASAFVWVAALIYLPVRVVHEINPDWPLANWVLTLLVVGLSLHALFLAGGGRWVRHFAFPICFILVAVRWPYRLEHLLTQNLMQMVASLTVEILGWMNVPALQRGNLIELSTGLLGVDEACSGIRSMQSTLMASLFLGELYQLRLSVRWLFVGAGLTLAFAFNVCRTLLLTWQANAHGLAAIDRWHDPAGFAIAVASFAALWLLAVLIRRRWTSPVDRKIAPGPAGALSSRAPSPALRPYLLAVGCWAIVCLATTEIWYRAHGANQPLPTSWSVQLPETAPSFRSLPPTPEVVKMLKSDASFTGQWQEPDGSEWTLYFFRWNPHSMQSVISARLHRPEVCLSGLGLRQLSMSPLDTFTAGALQIPFHKYTFEARGAPLHVFFSLWEDGNEHYGMHTLDRGDRMRWALAGRRQLGQQTLEIICRGYPDLATAESRVRQRLPGLIRSAEKHASASGD